MASLYCAVTSSLEVIAAPALSMCFRVAQPTNDIQDCILDVSIDEKCVRLSWRLIEYYRVLVKLGRGDTEVCIDFLIESSRQPHQPSVSVRGLSPLFDAETPYLRDQGGSM